ncbi:unnamed protein product [Lampetra planeri]
MFLIPRILRLQGSCPPGRESADIEGEAANLEECAGVADDSRLLLLLLDTGREKRGTIQVTQVEREAKQIGVSWD